MKLKGGVNMDALDVIWGLGKWAYKTYVEGKSKQQVTNELKDENFDSAYKAIYRTIQLKKEKLKEQEYRAKAMMSSSNPEEIEKGKIILEKIQKEKQTLSQELADLEKKKSVERYERNMRKMQSNSK